jgi:transglutaminase-like putative cysteine protease
VQHFVNWQQDPFSNYLARLVFPEKTTEFASPSTWWPRCRSTTRSTSSWSRGRAVPFTYEPASHELAPYLVEASHAALCRLVDSIDRTPRATLDFLVALNQRLQQDIRYLIRMEPGVQTPRPR